MNESLAVKDRIKKVLELEKISEGNRRYNSELSKLAKSLKPIRGKAPVSFQEINYYKTPRPNNNIEFLYDLTKND